MSKYSFKKYLLKDLKDVAKYPSKALFKHQPGEYMLQLEALKGAHPLTSKEDIDRGVYTHTLVTGGKFLFNDEPVPSHVEFPGVFSRLNRGIRESAPRVLGRSATFEDVLWLCLHHVQVNRRSWDLDACLTEAVSRPYHRFFVDLDLLFKAPHESSAAWGEFVKRLCWGVGQSVLQCYPEVARNGDLDGRFDFTVITSKGYREKTVDGDRRVYKRGIHLVWPGLIVDKERSETLARAIDEYLSKTVARDLRSGENSWKKALDLSVYASGLRPPGSPKIQPCSKCRPVAQRRTSPGMTFDEIAHVADGVMCHPPFGFIDQGEESAYGMEFLCRGDGVLYSKKTLKQRAESFVLRDEVTERSFDFSLQRLCSIRSVATAMTAGFDPPSHLRKPVVWDVADYRMHPRQDLESGDYLPEPKRKKINGNSFELLVSKESVHFLTRILRRFKVSKYDNIIVDKVWAFPTEDRRKKLPARTGESPKSTLYSHVWVLVKGEGSHSCHLKGGDHGSSTIRFVIWYDGSIAQGCWSQKVGAVAKRPCCKATTKGVRGFNDMVEPSDYGLLADLFLSRNPDGV